MAEYIIQGETLTSLADEIRVLSGTTDKLGTAKMIQDVSIANADIADEAELIAQITSALQGKAAGDGEGSGGKPEQTKEISITENGEYEVLPDEGYTLSGVSVNVEIVEEDDFAANFQRVEYITSAEAETYPYIITDFIADNTCGVEVVASFPAMADRIPMGSRLDSGSTRFYCVYPLSTSSCYYGFNTGSSISCTTQINTVYRLQTNFMNSRKANIYDANGNYKAGANITTTLTQQTVPVAIFGYNYASTGVITSKREYKFYGARCSRLFEIVREYIPCYRKSDGMVGLYEKYTKQFLTSPVGAFAKGPDIAA